MDSALLCGCSTDVVEKAIMEVQKASIKAQLAKLLKGLPEDAKKDVLAGV